MAMAKSPREVEHLIIGAGPAGLQVGYFLSKSQLDYIILEASTEVGSFFERYPRHRKLISINKIHTGRRDPAVRLRWDWNSLLNEERRLFSEFSQDYFPPADAMVAYLRSFAAANALNVETGQQVRGLSRRQGRFNVRTATDTFSAACVVVATGLSEPYVPPIEGIEHAETYADFDTDPRRYIDKRVLVIGKGNSGFETAESLIPFAAQIHVVSPHNVKHAWNSHHVGDLRAVNNGLIDTDHLKGQNATIWGEILSIVPFRSQYKVRISHTDSQGGVFTHVYDHLICCTGFKMSRAFFDHSTDPERVINGRLPKLTPAWESTNVENLFFAGALTQSRDFKKSSSAFIHGFRYNAQALAQILSQRRGEPWPSRRLQRSAESVTNALMERINTASSLWHQFDLMSDVIDLGELEVGPEVAHYLDVPADHALSSAPFASSRCLLLGFTHRKPADPSLHPSFSEEPALHPVVRLAVQGEVVSEHHVLEDLEAEWFEEALYIRPLEAFVAAVLAASHPGAGVPPLEDVGEEVGRAG